MEEGMDNQIPTTSKVVVDTSKYLAIHTSQIPGQAGMEDGSHTDKVGITQCCFGRFFGGSIGY